MPEFTAADCFVFDIRDDNGWLWFNCSVCGLAVAVQISNQANLPVRYMCQGCRTMLVVYVSDLPRAWVA